MDKNEITPATGNPLALIGQMDLTKIDPDKIEKLLDQQFRWEANQAERAFNVAMSECQLETPSGIQATSRNQQTNSNYAKFDVAVRALKPVYTKHGFTISFGEEPCDRDGFILVVATVRHVQGHSEQFKRFAPIDNLGPKGTPTKTMLHGCESSMKYMQRKLLESIFCVAESDDADDDGQAAGAPEPITPEQANELDDLLGELEAVDKGGAQRFMKWAGVADVAELPASRYGECKGMILKAIERGAKA